MSPYVTVFVGMFCTLLAIINPLEAIPVFLDLMRGKNDAEHRQVARKACLYTLLLMFFFLIFGNLLLRIFEVPLSMVRVVGFFVSAMGVGLIAHGMVEFLQSYGVMLGGTAS